MDSDEEIYTVERILSHRSTKKGRVFLVKWLNYPLKESTWEPQENLFCKHIIAEYWDNPQPNKSLKRILQEEMTKRSTEGRRGSTSEGSASDDVDSRAKQRPRKRSAAHEKSSDDFDYRAFFKLGFTVSALIVIGFIIWSGNDSYYMQQFYNRRFQTEHAQHSEH